MGRRRRRPCHWRHSEVERETDIRIASLKCCIWNDSTMLYKLLVCEIIAVRSLKIGYLRRLQTCNIYVAQDRFHSQFVRILLPVGQLPVLHLLSRRFWGFSPRRGDTIHGLAWNLARRPPPCQISLERLKIQTSNFVWTLTMRDTKPKIKNWSKGGVA